MDESRRAFLRYVGVLTAGGLAGCNAGDGGSSTPTQPDATGPRAGPDESTPAATPTRTATSTETSTADAEPETDTDTETPGPGTEQAREADLTVGTGPDADFERLAAADRVAEPGDVVDLGAGEYAYTPTTPVTLRGVGTDRTTVVAEGLGTSEHPYFSGGEPFGCLDLTLNFRGDADWFQLTPVLFERARCTTRVLTDRLTAHDTVFEREVSAEDVTATGSTFTATVACAALTDTGSTFEANLSYEAPDTDVTPAVSLTDSTVQGTTTFAPPVDADSSFTAIDATFGEQVHLRTPTTATLTDCALNTLRVAGGARCTVSDSQVLGEAIDRPAVRVDAGDTIGGELFLRDSTVEGGRLNTAIRVQSGTNFLTVFDSTIRGRCRGTTGLDSVFEGNTFRNPGGFDYFMEEFEPGLVATNAFHGADVFVTNPDARLYSVRDQQGNYYSTYDRADRDGDGIIDTPRAIPGDEATDRYPLASSDLSRY